MTRILFTSGFAACILLAVSLRSEPADASSSAQLARRRGEMALGAPFGVMTDEQRASYRSALRASHGKVEELDSKLRAARQDLLNTTLSSQFDENLVREKALAVARIEAELSVIRARAISQVQPPLSADQIEKIKTSRPGPMLPLERQSRRESSASTNHDQNGLPPKQ